MLQFQHTPRSARENANILVKVYYPSIKKLRSNIILSPLKQGSCHTFFDHAHCTLRGLCCCTSCKVALQGVPGEPHCRLDGVKLGLVLPLLANEIVNHFRWGILRAEPGVGVRNGSNFMICKVGSPTSGYAHNHLSGTHID